MKGRGEDSSITRNEVASLNRRAKMEQDLSSHQEPGPQAPFRNQEKFSFPDLHSSILVPPCTLAVTVLQTISTTNEPLPRSSVLDCWNLWSLNSKSPREGCPWPNLVPRLRVYPWERGKVPQFRKSISLYAFRSWAPNSQNMEKESSSQEAGGLGTPVSLWLSLQLTGKFLQNIFHG